MSDYAIVVGLLIVSAIYLHALDPLPHPAKGWSKFWKGVGVVALIVCALVFAVATAQRLQRVTDLHGRILNVRKAVFGTTVSARANVAK